MDTFEAVSFSIDEIDPVSERRYRDDVMLIVNTAAERDALRPVPAGARRDRGGSAPPLRVAHRQPGLEGDVSWNFNKWLVGRDGTLVARWTQSTTPDDPAVIAAIEAELAK